MIEQNAHKARNLIEMSKLRWSALPLAILLVAGCGGPSAPSVEGEDGYTLDTLALDGMDSLAFDPAPQLEPASQMTIEFWVKPDWSGSPEFDPVIVSNAGAEGASYLVAVNRERDGLTVVSGEQVDVAPFDFTDGKLHHVALIDYGDTTTVMIDNQAVAELDIDFTSLPSDGLYVGSARGGDSAFSGVIGGLRVWDVAVSPNDLASYAMRDVAVDGALHPDLPYLAVLSEFDKERVVYPDE